MRGFAIEYRDLEILDQLGEGGYGVVCRARLRSGREVAVKTINVQLDQFDDSAKRLFYEEIENMMQLRQSAHIVEFLHFGVRSNRKWCCLRNVQSRHLLSPSSWTAGRSLMCA